MAETIAAVASGGGAIGVIRVSGPRAAAAAAQVFRPVSGAGFSACPPRRMIYGDLLDRDGRAVDRGLAAFFHAPHSYTGEDAAELYCHGSPVAMSLVLEALFSAGVRQAEPGEFTRRAVLAGKLDLAQAEAVVDLIEAGTADAVRAAHGRLTGALSRRMEQISDILTGLLAHFYAVVDYPDEELDPFRHETVASALADAEERLAALLATYERGRHLTDGVPCAIVGRPNAGKSSLLNLLVGYDRAIVTPLPGTTRDTVEERRVLGGVLLRLIDTAGLRDGGDELERMGIARSHAALRDAALVLLLVDGSVPLTGEDEAAMQAAEGAARVICVVNKADCGLTVDVEALRVRFPVLCVLSALTGEGLRDLESAVAAQFPAGRGEEGGALLANARQHAAALEAREAVRAARSALTAGLPADAVLSDAETALEALGRLTGRTVREDVVEAIFARFCVGK